MTCSDLGFLQDGGRMDWRGGDHGGGEVTECAFQKQ